MQLASASMDSHVNRKALIPTLSRTRLGRSESGEAVIHCAVSSSPSSSSETTESLDLPAHGSAHPVHVRRVPLRASQRLVPGWHSVSVNPASSATRCATNSTGECPYELTWTPRPVARPQPAQAAAPSAYWRSDRYRPMLSPVVHDGMCSGRPPPPSRHNLAGR